MGIRSVTSTCLVNVIILWRALGCLPGSRQYGGVVESQMKIRKYENFAQTNFDCCKTGPSLTLSTSCDNPGMFRKSAVMAKSMCLLKALQHQVCQGSHISMVMHLYNLFDPRVTNPQYHVSLASSLSAATTAVHCRNGV